MSTRYSKLVLISFRNLLALLFIFSLTASYGLADTQSVELVPQSDDAGLKKFTLLYNVESSSSLTTGLGLRIHFNSSAIAQAELLKVFPKGLIVCDLKAKEDAKDYDDNPATDLFLVVAWMDLGGQWPYSQDFPLEIATLVLKLKEGGDDVRLGVSATSSAAGYNFVGDKY